MHAGGCQGSVSCWRLSGGCPCILEVVRVVLHAGGCQGGVHACWRLSGQCPSMLQVVSIVSMHAGGCQGSVHACCRLSLCLFCLCNVIQNFNFVSYFLDICYIECDGFVWFSLQKIPLCNHRIRKCCEFAQFQEPTNIEEHSQFPRVPFACVILSLTLCLNQIVHLRTVRNQRS